MTTRETGKKSTETFLVDDTTNVHLTGINNGASSTNGENGHPGWSALRGFTGLASLVTGRRQKGHYVLRPLKTQDQRTADEIFQCVRDGDVAGVQSIVAERPETANLTDSEGLTSILYCAKYNRPEILEYLLENGADVNARSLDGENALHMSAKFGNTEVTKILLASNCNVNGKDDQGRTALHHGCRRGNLGVVELLLKSGSDVNMKDDDLNTPLHLSSIHGNTNICRLLIEKGANCHVANISKITPCMQAAAEGHRQVLELLIAKCEAEGTSIQSLLEDRDDEGAATIHFAVQNGQNETLKYCIEKGVDLNQAKQNGATPLHIAVANGFTDIARYLLDNGADPIQRDGDQMTPMHKCGIHNRVDIAKMLLARGADVNAKDTDWFTPLHCAAWKGHPEMIEFLISSGANVVNRDVQMKTPLHWAVEGEKVDSVISIIEETQGSVVNSEDRNEQTPLHYAAAIGNAEIIKILSDSGANVSAKDFEEKSALHLASEFGKYDCVQMLLELSSEETNDEDMDGNTPLLLASKNGHSSVVMLLLNNGADLSIRDENRRTALMLAARNGHSDCIAALLDNNADLDAVDKSRNSALSYCSRYGHADCVSLLLQNQASIAPNNLGLSPLDIALQYKHEKACAAFFDTKRWKSSMALRNSKNDTPMKALIENVPDIAEDVLNMCIESRGGDPFSDDFTLRYNYRYIDPGPEEKRPDKKRYFALQTMVDRSRETLLHHPLVHNILQRKWVKFARYFFYTECILYCVFLACLTAYIMESDPPTEEKFNAAGCPIHHKNVSPNVSQNYTLMSEERPHIENTHVLIAETMMYIVLALNVLQHVTKIIVVGYRYFLDFSVYLYWSLFVFTFLFIYPPGYEPCSFQWNMGAMASFLAWSMLVFYLLQFEFFGLYCIMFGKVLVSMVKTMLIFTFFIVAFAEALHIMLAKQPAFKDVPLSIIRVLVMAIGEIDYVSTFVENSDHPFKETSEFIFVLFLFFMPIVLMNLLVGVAVGDIEGIKQDAYVEKIRIKVNYIYDLETRLPLCIQRKLWEPYCDVKPNLERKRLIRRIRNFIYGKGSEEVVSRVKKTHLQDLIEEFAQGLKTVMHLCKKTNDLLEEKEKEGKRELLSTRRAMGPSMRSLRIMKTSPPLSKEHIMI